MMTQSRQTPALIIYLALILVAIASRLINAEMHWYNFGPLVAISLFSGALLKNRKLAYLIPLLAYFVSDVILEISSQSGFYGISQFFVYAGMASIVLLGGKMRQPKALSVLGFSLCGSLLFWIISNLGVFAAGHYGYHIGGLITTYSMALPFYTHSGTELFFNQFLGDIIFSASLFGCFALINSFFQSKAAAAS